MENSTQKSNLYKNTIIIFISKFFTQFLSIIILPLVTAKLSTGQYGTFDLISTYGWFLTVFLTVQLENGIFRFLVDNRNKEENTKNIISNGIFSILIVSIFVTIIYFIVTSVAHIENSFYIYCYAVSALILNISLQISRGLGDNVSYAVGSLISGIFNIFFIFLFVYVKNYALNGMIIAYMLSNIIGATYIILKKRIYKYIEFSKINRTEEKKLIKYSLPLVPNNVTSWILNLSDKTMLSLFISTSTTGIYSVSTKFSTLMSHVVSVFNLSWTESASLYANEKDRNEFFSEQVNNIFKICSSLCLLCVAIMPIIFGILIDSSYNEAYIYIPILIVGSIFETLSVLLGGIYISLKKSKEIAISTCVSAVVNIVINLLFMKKWGIYVACCSTVIAYVVLTLYRYFDIKRYVKIKLDIKAMIKFAIVYILICICYYSNRIYLEIIALFTCIIFAFLFNKNMIRFAIETVKSKAGK